MKMTDKEAMFALASKKWFIDAVNDLWDKDNPSQEPLNEYVKGVCKASHIELDVPSYAYIGLEVVRHTSEMGKLLLLEGWLRQKNAWDCEACEHFAECRANAPKECPGWEWRGPYYDRETYFENCDWCNHSEGCPNKDAAARLNYYCYNKKPEDKKPGDDMHIEDAP